MLHAETALVLVRLVRCQSVGIGMKTLVDRGRCFSTSSCLNTFKMAAARRVLLSSLFMFEMMT